MLESLLKSRVLLVTGKGGVGKTCLATAIARAGAVRGQRVLLTEVATPGDDYSPLAAHFGLHRFDRVKREIEPGLHAVILLAQVGHRIFFESVLKNGLLMRAALESKPMQRLLASAPSGREIGLFIHLLSLLEEKLFDGRPAHDLVVVDMPATGHALALTSLPRALLRMFERGPVARAVQAYLRYLSDPELTKAVVVSLAESLPVSEALELIDGLEQTDISVGGVVVNRAPPMPFSQADISAITTLLADKPILGRESFAQLVAAREAVARLAGAVNVPTLEIAEFAGDNPAAQIQRTLDQHLPTESRPL